MTTAERVQTVYAWALEVRDRPKATMMLMYCAGQVRIAIENSESEWDVARDNILEVVADWQQSKSKHNSTDLQKAIKVVSIIMGLPT